MERYLLTGATGFVGTRLLKYLSNINCTCRILSRAEVRGYDFHICDFEKNEIPSSALDSIDIVFHLAGIAHDIKKNGKHESTYYSVNVNSTINLAKKAAKAGVKKFIFVSSTKAGGRISKNLQMDENHQNKSDDIYGITKREAEIKILEIGRQSEMDVSIIRPSLVYGPNMKGNLRQMMNVINKGWFPPLPKNNNKRSMVHVDDLVRAIYFIACESKTNGEIYILTDGRVYSSREIYETFCNVLGRRVPNWYVPYFIFKIISLINQDISSKVDKLLGNEYYSSKKLSLLGFKTKKTFKEMNETSF